MSNPVETPASNFNNRVRSAVFWRSGTQILSQIVSWTVTVLVVRLLRPEDYGLFAMSQVVMVMLNFLNGYGFASALISADIVDKMRIKQTFGLLILLNVSLAALQFLGAPLAATYFHQPMVTTILRWQCLLYLPTPFIALPSALLARGLDFKKQAMTNVAAMFAGAGTSLLCILLLPTSERIWTLIVAPIVGLAVRALGLTLAARLLVWPSFRFRGAGDIIRFGSAMVIAQFFWIIQSQADVTIAGRVITPHTLGLYAEALFLTQIFAGKFLPPLNEVAFPSYAELAKSGGDVGPAFVTAARLVMAITLPLYAGLMVTAHPLVLTLFGPKWIEMAPLVTLLALAMPFWTLQLMFQPATNALGRPEIYARLNALGALLLTAGFLLGIRYGVIGLTLSWLITAPALLLVTARMSLPVMRTTGMTIFTACLPSLLAAAAMAASVHYVQRFLTGFSAPAQLLLLACFGIIFYFGLLFTLARGELDALFLLVMKRKLTALPQAV